MEKIFDINNFEKDFEQMKLSDDFDLSSIKEELEAIVTSSNLIPKKPQVDVNPIPSQENSQNIQNFTNKLAIPDNTNDFKKSVKSTNLALKNDYEKVNICNYILYLSSHVVNRNAKDDPFLNSLIRSQRKLASPKLLFVSKKKARREARKIKKGIKRSQKMAVIPYRRRKNKF